MIVLLTMATALADCPDPTDFALQARSYLLEGRMEEADEEMKKALEATACELITPEALAQLWLTDAAYHALSNDPIAARASFKAAHRSSPETWDPALGDDLRAMYEEVTQTEGQPGVIEMAELPRGYFGALDGVRTDFPVEASEGRHLVNIIDKRNNAYSGDMVYVPPGEHIEVEFDPLPAHKRPTLLYTGAVSALAAGSLAFIASQQDSAITGASSIDNLEAAYSRQRVLAYSSYGFLGLAATSVTAHFMF